MADDWQECAPTAENCRAIDPIRLLQQDNALRLDLCDLLEHIADSLPENAAPQIALLASAALERGWANHVAFEEQALFPILGRHRRTHPDLVAGLDQLSLEHAVDVGLGQELVDTLNDLARGGPPQNPQMVGYLLRSHFVPMRRHILWENAFLVPAARRLLSVEDMGALRDWIRAREPDRCTCGGLD